MKKIVWIFGLVLGVMLSVNTMVMMSMMKTNPGFEGNEVVGSACSHDGIVIKGSTN